MSGYCCVPQIIRHSNVVVGAIHGCVDISTKPQEHTDEGDKPRITACQFVKTRVNAPKVLEFVETTLDQMTLTIAPRVIRPGRLGVGVWRDDRLHPHAAQQRDRAIRGVAPIHQHILTGLVGEQGLNLGDVIDVTPSGSPVTDYPSHPPTNGSCCLSRSVPSRCPELWHPRFFCRVGRAGMRFDGGAVQHHVLEIRLLGHGCQEPIPHPASHQRP